MKRKLGRLRNQQVEIPEIKNPPVVEVTWLDASSDNRPAYAGKAGVGSLLKDVGYLLFEDKDWMVISQEIGNGHARRTLDIPMYSIQKVRKMK